MITGGGAVGAAFCARITLWSAGGGAVGAGGVGAVVVGGAADGAVAGGLPSSHIRGVNGAVVGGLPSSHIEAADGAETGGSNEGLKIVWAIHLFRAHEPNTTCIILNQLLNRIRMHS